MIIGIDEAWRWPWAWSVVAWACFFVNKKKVEIIKLLKDSKKLTKQKRELLFEKLINLEKSWICYSWIGIVENNIIDEIGIKKANKLAMQEALNQILDKIKDKKIKKIQIDWNDSYIFENIAIPVEFIIKWDDKIDEIKAASILAKVTRDIIMLQESQKYPQYWFEKNMWYWTKFHQDALVKYWICPIHRKSYAPIKKILILKQK